MRCDGRFRLYPNEPAADHRALLHCRQARRRWHGLRLKPAATSSREVLPDAAIVVVKQPYRKLGRGPTRTCSAGGAWQTTPPESSRSRTLNGGAAQSPVGGAMRLADVLAV